MAVFEELDCGEVGLDGAEEVRTDGGELDLHWIREVVGCYCLILVGL